MGQGKGTRETMGLGSIRHGPWAIHRYRSSRSLQESCSNGLGPGPGSYRAHLATDGLADGLQRGGYRAIGARDGEMATMQRLLTHP